MMLVSEFGNTRAGIAIKSGAVAKRIHGIPTVKIELLKAFAEGQCCGVPYATEYVSSDGASVHVWLGNGLDDERMAKLVRALLFWKDVTVLTWSYGEPVGYQTYYRLDTREDRQETANEKSMSEASGF